MTKKIAVKANKFYEYQIIFVCPSNCFETESHSSLICEETSLIDMWITDYNMTNNFEMSTIIVLVLLNRFNDVLTHS